MCRWEIRKADKQGVVEIDSHRYLAGPSWHGWTLDVGLRAFDVEIRTQDGRSVARLPRVYGKDPGTVRNPASLLPALARKTRAWGESPIRGDFPDKLRLAIDAQDSRQRRRTFRLIEYLTCWGPGLLRLGAIMSFGGYCVSRPGLLRLGAVVG